MLRGTTARNVIAFLAAALLCLPVFAATTSLAATTSFAATTSLAPTASFTPTTSFASTNTPRQAEANSEPGHGLPGKAVRDEVVTHHERGDAENPIAFLPTRNRHRTTHAVPQAPERPSQGENAATAHDPVAPAARHHRAERSQTAHTPTALQVFRC